MDERREAAIHGRRNRLQALLLDTARVLMLLGVGTIFSAGFVNPAASSRTQAFVGLLLWLFGVSLLVLVPVAAGRFLQLQAALAVAVLKHLLALCN
jgi:hypothetical protein